ncbi:MAG: MBL fold metallo-hydrolase [Fermentimonas sp.]|jgi:phosphoribosyl 1,2-cyclic phosphodiesterase
MQYKLFPSEKFSFFSLSSGSCGNCYYLGNSYYGILIDVGLGPRVIKKRLLEHGVELSSIMGILITHDHMDHIRSVGYMGEKFNIPVYATQEVHKAIAANKLIKNKLRASRRYIEKGRTFTINDFSITPFDVPHDSCDNSGYYFEFGGQRLTLATDIGRITEEIAHYISKANHLIIESNYDENMLKNGRYPWHLKERITSGRGHISNRQLSEFIANNFTPNIRNIWLCHLSGDNNNPELAYETMFKSLSGKGIEVGKDVALRVLKRNVLSERIVL